MYVDFGFWKGGELVGGWFYIVGKIDLFVVNVGNLVFNGIGWRVDNIFEGCRWWELCDCVFCIGRIRFCLYLW